ncbi:hypothetical protein BCR32DRAFT_241680 [Anaeromyces robustus]|uniref:Uncharacterized protein n=1 Tax=Anaeromyces robustus TaxID=1754192 RepID=A0A1Y1XIT9_9FUNG|nr:hypothetical protein BCR32DRAFT_241680 [Anaeromyces robustus]|eukprot:ORX85612.1 hypothetical protein BCR32DRAFT_241680 [Anaeromyces robustus]
MRELFFRKLPKEITFKISKYSLNVFFLCIGNQISKQDMIDIFENYDYSKDDYFDIIEYSLIPTLLYYDKFYLYKDLNLNWSINDTILAYYAIKYKRYSVIQKPLFVDKLFLEGFLKNHSEAISAVGHYLYYIPENNCSDFFKMYYRQGQATFKPSKYSIQFKNKEVYYDLLKELLPNYSIYEKYIYGSQTLLNHLNNVLDIEKIVNQAEEKNCSLKSVSPCSSPTTSGDRLSFSSHSSYSSQSSQSSQDINKFYPYLYDYLLLFDSGNSVSIENIFKLTMNSWNCSLVSLIICDVFHGKTYGKNYSKLDPQQALAYQEYLINAKRMANAYTLEDDLLQYRLIMEEKYLQLERLFDLYSKILEYDIRSKGNFYRIDHLFHIFFPTIILLTMNKNVKKLKVYVSLLTHKRWIEHVLALFQYAIDFYQFKLDKFPHQIEKLRRKYPVEFRHYQTVLNKYLSGNN